MDTNLTLGPAQPTVDTEYGVLVHSISWVTPYEDSWRLNFSGYTTGAANGNAGAGCVLRDQNAIFKAACAAPIKDCENVEMTELVALNLGLDIALRQGVDYIEIAGDYSIVIRLLAGESIPFPSSVQSLIEECSYFLAKFRGVMIRQVPIHANEPANLLAIFGSGFEEPLQWFDKPPPEIADSLIGDVIGRWMPLDGL